MSIQLPKYTISTQDDKPKKNPLFLILIFSLLAFATGYFGHQYFSVNSIASLQQRNDVLEKVNSQNTTKINQQQAQISILTTEKKVKQQALIDLQENYKKSIDLNNSLKADVTFYERLLSPNAKNTGLRVFQAQIVAQKDNKYMLKLILVQKIERAREIAGKYEIYIEGQLNNKQKSYQISLKSDTKFKFKYFHKVSLPFSLANGFKAQELVVKLFPKNNKTKTIEYRVDWQTLINQE